jgi:hypothetical protein
MKQYRKICPFKLTETGDISYNPEKFKDKSIADYIGSKRNLGIVKQQIDLILDYISKNPDSRQSSCLKQRLELFKSRGFNTSDLNKAYLKVISSNQTRKDKPLTYSKGLNLEAKFFTYRTGEGIVEITPEETRDKKYFQSFFNSKGKELLRQDYDEKGILSKITAYSYSKDELAKEDFYRVQLEFSRIRDKETGLGREIDAEGKTIRKLTED